MTDTTMMMLIETAHKLMQRRFVDLRVARIKAVAADLRYQEFISINLHDYGVIFNKLINATLTADDNVQWAKLEYDIARRELKRLLNLL